VILAIFAGTIVVGYALVRAIGKATIRYWNALPQPNLRHGPDNGKSGSGRSCARQW
jgi:hypothetical protein